MLAFSIGAVVLIQQPSSRKHVAFFLVTFTGVIWLLGYAFLNLLKDPEQASLSLRLCYLLGVPHLSPSAYFFSLELNQRAYQRKKLFFSYALAFLLGIVFFVFHEHIVALKAFPWGVLNSFLLSEPLGLAYFIAILAHMFTYAGLAYLNLNRALRAATSPIEKRQFKFFIFAFFIGYLSPSDYLVSVGISNFAFGYATFSLFVSIVAYTIIRHKFLDVNLAVARFSMLFFIYSALFAVLLPFVFPIVTKILNQSNQATLQIVGLSMGIGLVLSLGPIIYAYIVHQSFWMRSTFTTGLTHELKSPLSIIQNAAEMSLMNIESPNGNKEQAIRYLGMVQQNANRLDDFVKTLLNVARSENGAVELQKKLCDFQVVLKKVHDIYLPLYDVGVIQLRTTGPGELPIEIDQEKMEQVLSNILSNALKFSKEGIVEVATECSGSILSVRVRDQGIGIPRRFQEKIFERFFQLDTGKKGSGIGLTIAKAWVEAHGGKIWAESEGEGKGTTVTFTLPTA